MYKSTGFEFDVEILHELNKVIKNCQFKDIKDIQNDVIGIAKSIEDELMSNNICQECGSTLEKIIKHDDFEDEDVALVSCFECGYMERKEKD